MPKLIPAAFERWAKLASSLGFTDIITPEDGFRTCLISEAPWANSNACGIYCWIADNGESYVGQTVAARARLRSHWRNHPDISYACFQVLPRDRLDEFEVQLIEQVGSHFPTRNIKHAIETQAYVAFDAFVTKAEREMFLAGVADLPNWEWRPLPVLEQKQARKFDSFKRDEASAAAIKALGLFVTTAIPKPASTEARFWSVSLLTQGHLLRVNAGQQEVCTVSRGSDGNLYARPLTLERFGPGSGGPLYRSRSYDAWVPVDQLDRWLVGERLRACRELIVRLMRHTTTLNSGSHCPQVVRAACSAPQFG